MSKFLSISVICVSLCLLSCDQQAEPHKSPEELKRMSVDSVAKKQRDLSDEIVSVELDFAKALEHANKTVGASFAADVDKLSARLEKVSKELDTLGSFSSDLQDETRKRIDDNGNKISQLTRNISWRPMQPNTQKLTEQAGDRYFQVWGDVCNKAGIDRDAERNGE
jgi:hypothetical protein